MFHHLHWDVKWNVTSGGQWKPLSLVTPEQALEGVVGYSDSSRKLPGSGLFQW